MYTYAQKRKDMGEIPRQRKSSSLSPQMPCRSREARYVDRPVSLVLQKKSTRRLEGELKELGITAEDVVRLAEEYDALETTDETKSEQTRLLQELYERLSNINEESAKRALKIVLTEMSFVFQQNFTIPYERPSLWKKIEKYPDSIYIKGLIEEYDSLWIKNSGAAVALLLKAMTFQVPGQWFSFIKHGLPREIGDIITEEISAISGAIGTPPQNKTTDTDKAAEPYQTLQGGDYWKAADEYMPQLRQKNSSEDKVKLLSDMHMQFLEQMKDAVIGTNSPDKDHLENVYQTIKNKAVQVMRTQGVLAHYSHLGTLTSMESNDQLRESGMLQAPLEDVNKADSQTIGADKSQDFDKKGIGNTGFAFCFLEKKGAPKRRSRFGKNRYTTSLDGNDVLNQAWAIMNDLQESWFKSHPFVVFVDPVKGNFSRDVITDHYSRQLEPVYANVFSSLLSRFPDMDKKIALISVLNFQNVQKKRTVLKYGGKSISLSEKNLGANFLYGQDIINGIAARTAAELLAAKVKLGVDIGRYETDGDKLWEYIAQVAFKMQIMVPFKILPEFVEKDGEPETEIDLGLGRFRMNLEVDDYRGAAGAGQQPPVPLTRKIAVNPAEEKCAGENNSFFACVLPLLGTVGSNAGEIRRDFQHRLRNGSDGGLSLALGDGEPVSIDHIKKFAELYHIEIHLIIHTQGGKDISVLYGENSRGSEGDPAGGVSRCEIALLLPKLRSADDNPTGRYVLVR